MRSPDSAASPAPIPLDGFIPASPPRVFWNARRRVSTTTSPAKDPQPPAEEVSEKRRQLFEPLEPSEGKRVRAEDLLPPPDFDNVSYPKGWLVGKRRKLVNVDVVESMRRIAVQEMNRKLSNCVLHCTQDREIDGLNEQLEEDGKCLERLQLQLLEERSKRANVEREKTMLENQVAMLMDMLQGSETMDEVGDEQREDHHE